LIIKIWKQPIIEGRPRQQPLCSKISPQMTECHYFFFIMPPLGVGKNEKAMISILVLTASAGFTHSIQYVIILIILFRARLAVEADCLIM
jgi:hypothetical protein